MRNVEKFIVLLLLVVAIAIPACSQKEAKAPEKTAAEQGVPAAQAGAVKNPSGLSYTDLVPGKGASPVTGKSVTVLYTGWLENGTKFDSSLDRGQPFVFRIGVGEVIPGWDEGVMSMKVGGKRKLFIPAQLGYGAAGAGGLIPPNANLIFEVELLDVEK
jgi:peptidylprolyl isomerase